MTCGHLGLGQIYHQMDESKQKQRLLFSPEFMLISERRENAMSHFLDHHFSVLRMSCVGLSGEPNTHSHPGHLARTHR